MRHLPALLAAFVLLAAPSSAQEAESDPADIRNGLEQLSDGARTLLRGLMGSVEPEMRDMAEALREWDFEGIGIDDLGQYHPPEKLPNGDIILRRKEPLDGPADDPMDDEIEIESRAGRAMDARAEVGLGQMFGITLGPGNIDLSIPATMTLAATFLVACFSGGAAPNMGQEYLLSSIAVVVIGGSSIGGGRSNVPGVPAAAPFLFLIVSMLNSYGFGAGLRLLLTGAIIVGIVAIGSRPVPAR